ncbi:MAG: polysaccharide deacetylase family protein [Actinomycetes bacterium]
MIRPRRRAPVVALIALLLAGLCAAGINHTRSASASTTDRAAVIQQQKLTGCVPQGARYRENGWRGRRWVALTFDGGPTAEYTARVLAQLRQAKVHVTFFIRGQFIKGHTNLLRKELADGHELANHSYSHPHFPSSYELSRTNKLIYQASGYTPCLFRAPYGSIDNALLGRARHLHMLTIGWDVDSWDSLYDNVSKATVYSRVVNRVRPGSIILMHDGEGSHKGTLQALGPILRNLAARHLQVVPVSQLLGLRELH